MIRPKRKTVRMLTSLLTLLIMISVMFGNIFSVSADYKEYGELYVNMRGISYFLDDVGLYGTSEYTYDDEHDYYVLPSVSISNINRISLGIDSDILYFPDLYDYYLLLTVYSNTDVSSFSFAPDLMSVQVYNCDGGLNYALMDVNYYHHDFVSDYTGFTLTGKIPNMNSTAISYIELKDDNGGTVPSADIFIKVHVIKVEKNSDTEISIINKKLDDINNSINQQGNDIHGVLDDFQQNILEQNRLIAEENAIQSSEQHDELINGFDASKGNQASSELSNALDSMEEIESGITDKAFEGMDEYTIPEEGVTGYAQQFLTTFPLVAAMMQSIYDSSGPFNILLSVTFTFVLVSILIGLYRFYKD